MASSINFFSIDPLNRQQMAKFSQNIFAICHNEKKSKKIKKEKN